MRESRHLPAPPLAGNVRAAARVRRGGPPPHLPIPAGGGKHAAAHRRAGTTARRQPRRWNTSTTPGSGARRPGPEAPSEAHTAPGRVARVLHAQPAGGQHHPLPALPAQASAQPRRKLPGLEKLPLSHAGAPPPTPTARPELMWTAEEQGKCHAEHAFAGSRSPHARNSGSPAAQRRERLLPVTRGHRGSSLSAGGDRLSPCRGGPGPVRCHRRPAGPPGCPSPAGTGGRPRGPGSRRPRSRVRRRQRRGR